MLTVQTLRNRLYQTPISRCPIENFHALLRQYVHSSSRVLDIGAGAGIRNGYQLRGQCREIVGVDVDRRVLENPLLDRGVVADAKGLPFEDESFDVAFTIFVLEHIEDPASFVSEVRRVLKPGGYFLSLTPNRYHYVPLIAALTPTSFHKWFNKKRGRDEDDTFPTRYRMNSRHALTAQFGAVGFETVAMQMIEVEPNYLKFSVPTYLCGAAYERAVNSSDLLAGLRVGIICAFRKAS